ncbi:hypothetical protein EV426DRAFT_247207 [Tirmania nivea]|nr:hypothetical protein EV426DRAFT_247207 [Tirmania nivea]
MDALGFKRVNTGESRLRQKLRKQEVERQDSLAAIRQGKEFHVAGVDEPPEDMMEEADFVQALTELSTSIVEDITETSGMEFMDVGDLIELRSFGGGSELGIFIQPPLQKNGNFLFLTESGRIKTWPTTGMVFTIPKFTPAESAELLRKYLNQISEGNDALMLDPPRHLTKPLTDKIREFQKNALNVFSSKLPIMERLYDIFSYETEARVISTHEAAKVIFPEGYENHQFYALHLALMDDPRHFIADNGRNHKKTTEFEVRSRKQLEILRTVTEWLRRKSVTLATGKVAKKHSDVVDSFVKKAAALIDKSRELRGNQKDLFKPVEQILMPEFAWDENDKAIIEFLKYSLTLYWFQNSPFAPHYPQVLKATGRYKEEWKLDLDLLYIFLMEIGVYRPWENKYRFSHRMPLPYHGMSQEADALADQVAEVDKDAEAAWQKLALKDKMESFREDITETIYAIDDPSAEEIDDGISLTAVSETESWVHVHVANPTAFLEPGHWIAEMAKEKFQTIYLPEKTFGMIPRGLVDYKWGLASNRPTLTISVKVNNQSGEVLDYKIRFGNAKNVRRLTYANFNTILGLKPTAKPFTLVVNPPRDPVTGNIIEHTPPNPVVQVSPEEEAVLKQLRSIAVSLKKSRVASGCLSFVNESFRISVKDHPLDPSRSNRVDINSNLPILHKGLPTLTFTRDLPPTAAHETVAEFMLLGGTIVSRFLSTHKIPAPFRAHSIIRRQGAAHIWENVLLPERNEMGLIDKNILRDHFNILGSTRLQAHAESHQLLGIRADPESGIGGYTKATSPLRRYLDMVVHFQLQQVIHNLRDGLPATQNLPYSQVYLEKALPFALTKERTIRDLQQAAEKFWVWKLIRWGTLESKVVPGREHLMPKHYTMELTSKNQYLQASMGLVKEFGVVMKCWFNDEHTYETAAWGCLGDVQVDDSMWSRIKVNMRWIKSHPPNKDVPRQLS